MARIGGVLEAFRTHVPISITPLPHDKAKRVINVVTINKLRARLRGRWRW